MRIFKLTANNFKKLTAVEITPDGNVVIISGRNEQGKSSVLDSLEASLRGGRCLPKDPIRHGEHRAVIVTELGEDGSDVPLYKVTRKFLGANSTLKVETIGETKSEIRSPQGFLDKIVGDISFDPLAFMKQTPAEQRNQIMAFLGLNLDEFDTKIANLKEQRSVVRKEKESKLHEADSIVFTPGLPAEEQGSDTLLVELKTIQDHNIARGQTMATNSVTVSKIEFANKDITAAKKALVDWQARLDSLVNEKLQLESKLVKPKEILHPAEVEKKIATLNDTNEAIHKNAQKKQAMEDYETAIETYRILGDQVKITETNKALKMSQSVLPIEGLSILSDGLAYNGIPLEQECDSKKLKICVAIAMAMNPKLKVLRINGNELDSASLVAIGELVAGKDYQVWIEKVTDDNKIGFYIEDGTVIPRG
jgi:hypothetical protein